MHDCGGWKNEKSIWHVRILPTSFLLTLTCWSSVFTLQAHQAIHDLDIFYGPSAFPKQVCPFLPHKQPESTHRDSCDKQTNLNSTCLKNYWSCNNNAEIEEHEKHRTKLGVFHLAPSFRSHNSATLIKNFNIKKADMLKIWRQQCWGFFSSHLRFQRLQNLSCVQMC